MPGPAGMVQRTGQQQVLPEELCNSKNISAHCWGELEKVAGKGEGRAEQWLWPAPDAPLLQAWGNTSVFTNRSLLFHQTLIFILSVIHLQKAQLQGLAEMSWLTVLMLSISASICTLKILSPGPKVKAVFRAYLGLTILNLFLRTMSLGNSCLANVKI